MGIDMLERIFFDFGGCIDAPGIHTRTLFWDAFLAEKLYPIDQRAVFQEAYTVADQRMMRTGEAKNFGLKEFNRWNAVLIASDLKIDPEAAAHAGDRVTSLMADYLKESREALPLFRGFELGVISNFTGNLQVILKEFGLIQFFDSITESFYAGCSKPERRIFEIALASQKKPASSCLYIGDNPVNDIAPSKAMGMKAALIHRTGERKECGADYYVESLRDLASRIQSK